ncbi:hypothetical protein ACWCPI_25770 [Streptomyces sp. NPDC001920]
MTDLDGVRAAKRALAADLQDDPRVGGVGIGFQGEHYVITVGLIDLDQVPDLPVEVQGVPVRVVEAPTYTAQTG